MQFNVINLSVTSYNYVANVCKHSIDTTLPFDMCSFGIREELESPRTINDFSYLCVICNCRAVHHVCGMLDIYKHKSAAEHVSPTAMSSSNTKSDQNYLHLSTMDDRLSFNHVQSIHLLTSITNMRAVNEDV